METTLNNNTEYLITKLREIFRLHSDYDSEICVSSIETDDKYIAIGGLLGSKDNKFLGDVRLFEYDIVKRRFDKEEFNNNICKALLYSLIDKNLFSKENLTIRENI